MTNEEPVLLPEHTATQPVPVQGDDDVAIDTGVLDELEATSRPVIDPWSREASRPTTRTTSTSSPDTPAPPLPQRPGSEWSRANAAATTPAWYGESSTAVAARPPGVSAPVAEMPAQTSIAAGNRLWLDILAIGMALVGGLMGLIGSVFQELQSGVGIVLVVLAAPVIEEVLKPSGIYLLQVKWPRALRSQLHTALLCAISGAVFGVVESLIYVTVYYPEGSDAFVLFRFTVTPIMHATASFVVGWGITQALIDWANGKTSLPKSTRNAYVAGIALHAIYNTSAIVLGLLGVLDFLDT